MRALYLLVEIAFVIFIIVIWVAGWVIAKGFWSTLGAVILPFWSWYLIIEQIMIRADLL